MSNLIKQPRLPSSAILILHFILHNTVAALQTLRNQLAQVLEGTSFVEEILLGQIETAARIRQNLAGIRQNAAVLPIS